MQIITVRAISTELIKMARVIIKEIQTVNNQNIIAGHRCHPSSPD